MFYESAGNAKELRNQHAREFMHKILRISEVVSRTGYAKSTIYEKIAESAFPTQIRLGPKSVGWLETDIQNWIEEKISRSKSGTTPNTIVSDYERK